MGWWDNELALLGFLALSLHDMLGPPAMIEKAAMPALKKIGFDPDWNLYSF